MSKRAFVNIALLVLVVLSLIRFVAPDNDPPLFYTGHGQALLTDPYNLTFFARNANLYDDANPFDFHRWDIFKYSAVSLSAMIAFSISDVSRVSANVSGSVLQLLGFLFFLWGIFRKEDITPTLIAGSLLLLNSSLFFYGRFPFLENGLIFLSGLTFFVMTRYYDKIWGQIAVGAIVAMAGLSGKLFGLILIGPLVLSLIYIYRKKSLLPLLYSFAGGIAASALYLFAFYGGDIALLLNYYSEQSVGMYNVPPGLSSVGGFFKMLVTYGGESGLNQYAPFAMLLTAFSLIVIATTFPLTGKFDRNQLPLFFCAAWMACGFLGLMPFYYRPIRYALFLYLPAFGLVAFAFRAVLAQKTRLISTAVPAVLVALFLIFWYVATQVTILFGPVGGKFKAGTESMAVNLLIALVATAIVFVLMRTKRKLLPRRTVLYILTLLLLSSATYQVPRIYSGLTTPGKHLLQNNRDLAQIVDGNAVLTGPYMAALTIDNSLKGLIYMFGLSNQQTDLFTRFPITHVVADRSNWSLAMKDYPFLKQSTKIYQVLVKDELIGLFRLPTAKVPMTDFERGAAALESKQPDSALVYFGRFYETYPNNLLGAIHLSIAHQFDGKPEKALPIAKEIEKRFPDNYSAHLFLAEYYHGLHQKTGQANYREKSEYHKEIVRELNPVAPGMN